MAQVVIVGAGFAGLSAARRLGELGVDDVVVVEARSRVGGRTKHGRIAGVDIDLGGMWMGPTQTRLRALAAHHGVKHYATPLDGFGVFRLAGREHHGPGEDLEGMLSVTDKLQYLWVQRRLAALAADLDVEAPWHHPRAAELDRTTFDRWLVANVRSARLRSLFRLLCVSVFCAEATQVSLLFFVHYLTSGGGLDVLASGGPGGAQNFLFHGGLHGIARAMAAELGDRIRLGEPVERIEHSAGGVVVHAATGVHEAPRAIVAVPPTLVSRIAFDPHLPRPRQRLDQRLVMGSAVKYWVAYERPFWRDRGFNGMVFRDDVPCSPCFDVTPPDADVALIAGFFDANHAIDHGDLGPDRRREVVTSMLADHFGPEARTPVEYVDVDWTATHWSNGCYGNVAPPGVYADFGEWLRRPIGPIHWAGTETSPHWTGYVEGAIRSGEAAADAVVAVHG